MVSDGLPTLRAGSLEVQLNPSIGGSIQGMWQIGNDGSRHPILRECHSAEPSVLDMASFPLVPFVNRIRGGRFTFRGREVRLQPNMVGDVSPLHGQGWLGRWTLESCGNQDAELRFVHEPGEWPWRYDALQVFALDESGLSVRLMCRNLSHEPMPCGLGQHPYFPCNERTVIDTTVGCAWEIDEHVLPIAKVPAAGRFDLRNRKVCGQGLDHGFGAWSGSASISESGRREIVLSSPDADFFQLYSPPEGGIFVAEPVTHANAALNAAESEWAELGVRVLGPGEEMALTMELRVGPV
ncbi:aldose 1-epimerase [Sphingomonas sp. GCM10030256]|uniref:aldose 1-epimerase n=1 Tax=Sphingomonas sp. GCM10030256 TaxID=3273427 RepID=UPI00361755F3